MARNFNELKERSDSGAELERLLNLTAYGVKILRGSRYKTRIKQAIKDRSAFSQMIECDNGKGKACFSVFCEHCRKVKQDRMYENYVEHFEGKYGSDEKSIRDNARFGTVLHSLVPVIVETESLEQETTAAVWSAVKELRRKMQKIVRRTKNGFRADIWVCGGVHVELVDYDRWQFASLSGSKTHKQQTYNDFIESSSSNAGGHYFLVHTHFLCDLDGIKDADFSGLFREQWSGSSRQVQIKRLTNVYESSIGSMPHDLDRAYRNIANYCYTGSNHDLAYAKNWGNSGKVIGTEENVYKKGDVKTFAKEVMSVEIDDELSVGHLRLLIQVHNALTDDNKQGLRIRVG